MAHKYDKKYCYHNGAYITRRSRYAKIQCNRYSRRIDKITLRLQGEEYSDYNYKRMRSNWWFDIVMW